MVLYVQSGATFLSIQHRGSKLSNERMSPSQSSYRVNDDDDDDDDGRLGAASSLSSCSGGCWGIHGDVDGDRRNVGPDRIPLSICSCPARRLSSRWDYIFRSISIATTSQQQQQERRKRHSNRCELDHHIKNTMRLFVLLMIALLQSPSSSRQHRPHFKVATAWVISTSTTTKARSSWVSHAPRLTRPRRRRTTNDGTKALPQDDHNNDRTTSTKTDQEWTFTRQNHHNYNNAASWSDASALCLIPPDHVWDTIQRARHVGRDATYAIWPPAIRLFHPFPHDDQHNIAFEIAQVIEAYNISTFSITLSEWSIIPHLELLNDHLYDESDDGDDDVNDATIMTATVWNQPSQRYMVSNEEDQTVQALIRSVEQMGHEKLQMRREKSRLKQQQQQSTATNHNDTVDTPSTTSAITINGTRTSSGTNRHRQKKHRGRDNDDRVDVYNGPCVICLEPDAPSQRRIQQLRQLLRQTLFRNISSSSVLYTSPTGSILSSSTVRNRQSESPFDYRPVVPIAAFSNVNTAIKVARQLRSLWKPLSFNVTDLHMISSSSASTTATSTSHPNDFPDLSPTTRTSSAAATTTTTAQYGCDALVTLMGVPLPADDQYCSVTPDDENCQDDDDDDRNDTVDTTEIVQWLCDHGEPGGYYYNRTTDPTTPNPTVGDRHRDASRSDRDDNLSSTTEELEQWLNEEDDEYDEGTVVIMGRTQFFTGEMRQYVGMPATMAAFGGSNVDD